MIFASALQLTTKECATDALTSKMSAMSMHTPRNKAGADPSAKDLREKNALAYAIVTIK